MRSAVMAVEAAIVAILAAHPRLKGDKVYHEGLVPPNSPLPYAIIGTASEPSAGRRITQHGRHQTIQIKWWAPNKHEAQRCYLAGVDLLSNPLPLNGHRSIKADLSYVVDFKQPGVPADAPGPHVVVSELGSDTLEV